MSNDTRKNFLVPYYDGNDNNYVYEQHLLDIGTIKDIIGFNDTTYLISIDNKTDDNFIHIFSYDNKFSYEEKIFLTEENTKNTNEQYVYCCSGKIDEYIDNNNDVKRIFALFKYSSNDIINFILYYNDNFYNFTSSIDIPYLEVVNMGMKLGFVDIVENISTIYYLNNNDDNITLETQKINEMFNDKNISILIDGNMNIKLYAYNDTSCYYIEPIKENNNENNNENIEIITNENQLISNEYKIKLSSVNKFTYAYKKINNEDYEYMNCLLKVNEIEIIDNEETIVNVQRFIYHFIKNNNDIKCCYTYYLGYDKDNNTSSNKIEPIKLTNFIFNNNFMTVDNFTNNLYIITLKENNHININYSDLNDTMINSNLYNEIQKRRTINNGSSNKYVFK